MRSILRNVSVGKNALKLESSHRVGLSAEEEKRYTVRDLRRAAAEAEIRTRLLVEEEAEQFRGEMGQRVDQAVAALAESDRALIEMRRQLLRESAEEIVELASVIARRILRVHLALPGTVQPLLEEVLDHLGKGHHPEVRLAPGDLAFLRDQGALARWQGDGIRFAADDTVTPGGCRVVTERGSWDAEVETQLDRIDEVLRASLVLWAGREAA